MRDIGFGLHTILGFKEPIKVKYETANLYPVEDIKNKIVRSLGMRKHDTIMYSEFFEVELDAHYLVVDTMKRSRREGAKFPYDTIVTRIDHAAGKNFLGNNPIWQISDFEITNSDGALDTIQKHNLKVDKINRKFMRNKPTIIYEGQYLKNIDEGFNNPKWTVKFNLHK